MAYALREKQREYQRNWKRNKRVKRKPNIISLKSIESFSNSKILTWQQLTGTTLKDIKSYGLCVTKAKISISTTKVNRLLIATLCERACIIKHGGKPDPRNLTLHQFATDIGVHPKTLWTWIDIKRRVVNQLPSRIGDLQWRAADLARRYMHAHKDTALTPVKLYERHLDGEPARQSSAVFKGLQFAAYYLKEHNTRGFTKEQIESMKQFTKIISRRLKH